MYCSCRKPRRRRFDVSGKDNVRKRLWAICNAPLGCSHGLRNAGHGWIDVHSENQRMAERWKADTTGASHCSKSALSRFSRHSDRKQVTANARSEQITMAQEAGMVRKLLSLAFIICCNSKLIAKTGRRCNQTFQNIRSNT